MPDILLDDWWVDDTISCGVHHFYGPNWELMNRTAFFLVRRQKLGQVWVHHRGDQVGSWWPHPPPDLACWHPLCFVTWIQLLMSTPGCGLFSSLTSVNACPHAGCPERLCTSRSSSYVGLAPHASALSLYCQVCQSTVPKSCHPKCIQDPTPNQIWCSELTVETRWPGHATEYGQCGCRQYSEWSCELWQQPFFSKQTEPHLLTDFKLNRSRKGILVLLKSTKFNVLNNINSENQWQPVMMSRSYSADLQGDFNEPLFKSGRVG